MLPASASTSLVVAERNFRVLYFPQSDPTTRGHSEVGVAVDHVPPVQERSNVVQVTSNSSVHKLSRRSERRSYFRTSCSLTSLYSPIIYFSPLFIFSGSDTRRRKITSLSAMIAVVVLRAKVEDKYKNGGMGSGYSVNNMYTQYALRTDVLQL